MSSSSSPNPAPAPTASASSAKSYSSPSSSHIFWSTQPVLAPDATSAHPSSSTPSIPSNGEVDPSYAVPIPHPLPLPPSFAWIPFSITSPSDLNDLYTLLLSNYVEDASALSRFEYSAALLQWALTPPNWTAEYHCAIRIVGSGKLVGFIAGTAHTLKIRGKAQRSLEINFLCVHKKLRDKRLAPVLIKEITRRISQEGEIRMAFYTAGHIIHAPIAETTYFHRPIHVKTLLDVGFIPRPPPMGRHTNAGGAAAAQARATQRLIKLNALPKEVVLKLRAMEEKDVSGVQDLLEEFAEGLALVPVYTKEELSHLLLPRKDIVYTWVVGGEENGKIEAMTSFYVVNRKFVVPGKAEAVTIRTAQALYNVVRGGGKRVDCEGDERVRVTLEGLVKDVLVLAEGEGCDVYSTLNIMGMDDVVKACKFMPSNGKLYYYFYNHFTDMIPPHQVGVVLV